MTVPSGSRLGHFEIRSRLGAGGMGEVYLADDTVLGRRVAIKVLPADQSADERARKRLVREARAAATLDHPHICAVYDVGEADGRVFIAMQYIEGETLAARLRGGPLALGDALGIAAQVADALAEAHAHAVLHRDIKPGNVMITPRGHARVMDFGLAKMMPGAGSGNTDTASALSMPGTLQGTVPYMSPEQVRGEELDGRSDIFSLGVMLYEMLSGRRPFDESGPVATASAILTRDPRPLARFAPDTPAELERIVAKALRKIPDERYQTAQDLLIDLRTLKDDRDFRHRLERESAADAIGGPGSPASPAENAGGALPSAPAEAAVAEAVVARRRAGSFGRRLATVAALAALMATGGWFAWRASNVRWATDQLPRIQALADTGKTFDAYDLVQTVEPYLADTPALAGLLRAVAETITVTTDPPGARVYLKRFAPDASGTLPARTLAGTTPVTNLRVARGEYVLSVELEGYAKIERTLSLRLVRVGTFTLALPIAPVELTLVPLAGMPARMVAVKGGDYRLVAWSRPSDRRQRLADFLIDKYEVTNREFKEFIDAGGYVKREYWTHSFVRDGRTLLWDEALRAFVDRTGLPGPRAWSSQAIPDGKADHPVTGVTWYEAAAYAAFRGKQLPTVFQWEKAARNGTTGPLGSFMPWGPFFPGDTLQHRANFANAGTLAVDSAEFGMSPYGAYNMAGNVTEWTLNDSDEGYFATGGSWADPTYVYSQFGARPGFYSADTLGFRCVRVDPGAGSQGGDRLVIAREVPVYTPSTDDTFAEVSAHYRYDATGLDARVEQTVETSAWTREQITFNGADGERAIAFLYLPKHVARPLQVLHYAPGGDVDFGMRALSESMDERLAPFVQSGRAALGVVLKGYVERLPAVPADTPPATTVEYLERIVNRVTDLRRGLDYMETRADLDATRVTFFGISAGSHIGLILAAVEPRYKAVVMVGSGLPVYTQRYIAGANPGNFASHIRVPKLQVQGRYDEDTPLVTAAEPLFKLFREPKRLVLFDGGHVPPVDLQMSVVSPWLDEVLGPVKR